MAHVGQEVVVISLDPPPHRFLPANMVSQVALYAVFLPLLVATGNAFGLGDSDPVPNPVDINLGFNPGRNHKVAAAWWASWHADLLPFDKISWEKYTHMTYAFA